MKRVVFHSAAELGELVEEVGFLPLLDMGLGDWSAEALAGEECRYSYLPDGGWVWPLWEWKGPVIQESGCAYGKFFSGKAGFISREWWPDFCNHRRAMHPAPEEGSIEEAILFALKESGSMITRELRAACGFTGPKMRSRFDGFVTRLQMRGYIVTENFVYPHDRDGNRYGWGWSLLAPAESIMGYEACHIERSPEESLQRITKQFKRLLPKFSDATISRLIL